MSRVLYIGLLACLAAERLHELRRARKNAARALARGGVERGSGHYPAMVALHTLFLPSCAIESYFRPFRIAVAAPALVGALAAQALRYWAISTLGDRWNTRIIVIPGEPLVTRGPYRYLRHPNYVAVALELACVPLVHGGWVTALAFSAANALVLRTRIRAEEAALAEASHATA
jgi:methyltransferase